MVQYQRGLRLQRKIIMQNPLLKLCVSMIYIYIYIVLVIISD